MVLAAAAQWCPVLEITIEGSTVVLADKTTQFIYISLFPLYQVLRFPGFMLLLHSHIKMFSLLVRKKTHDQQAELVSGSLIQFFTSFFLGAGGIIHLRCLSVCQFSHFQRCSNNLVSQTERGKDLKDFMLLQFAQELQCGQREKGPGNAQAEERQHPAAPTRQRPCSCPASMDSVQQQGGRWRAVDIHGRLEDRHHTSIGKQASLGLFIKLHYT